jgi:hypothetical protein
MAAVTERPVVQDPPYEPYAAITAAFVGGLGLAGLAAAD